MGNIKRTFLCIIAVLSAGLLFSQAPEKSELLLTIDDAVKLAKENNISVKMAENTLSNLKIQNRYSWNSVSPTLNLNGSYSNDIEKDVSSIGVTGSVNLSLKSNLFSEINNARLNYQKGSLSYSEALRSVELLVRKSFYSLIYQKENLALQKRNLETSYEQYCNNQEKFRNGKISELDAFTSQVNYESKKPSVEAAEISLKNDIAAFKQVLGLSQDVQIELKGSLDEILKFKEISMDKLPLSSSPAPEVKSAEYDVKLAKNSLLDSRFSAYSPSITGGYSLGKSKKSSSDEWTTTNQLSAGVFIPLDGYLPWSTKAVNVAAKKNSVKNAELTLENAKTSLAVETESYIRKINQAVKQLDSLKSTEELAQKTYQMTKTAYNYGKTDLLSLQNAGDAVLSAGVNLKSQAYSLLCTVLELEKTLGLEFGSLEKIEE